MSTLSIAISPCPNDTFVFEHFIFSSEYKISPNYFDIQVLNEMALQKKYDLIKVSFAMLPYLLKDYNLLKVGSALGRGNGPLVVSKKHIDSVYYKEKKIVSPGKFTTANLLFDYFFNDCKDKVFKVFSEIENMILRDEADMGIIIHEGRFTYEKKGLVKLLDLGNLWELKTALPIPLGCLLIKKSLPYNTQKDIQQKLQNSIIEARKKLPTISNYIKQYAQEMDEEVIRKHIQIYVNDFTYNLNEQGITAIKMLLEKNFPDFIFIESCIVE